MKRLDATRIVIELVGDSPIVGGVASTSFDLAAFDRATNFYMWNSMGMASSIAMGLALARPDLRVVCLDGDGSLLMNLGSMASISMAEVRNLVHVVWDNGGWDITGGQPAGTASGVDLEMIARGSGYEETAKVNDLDGLRQAMIAAMSSKGLWLIVAKIESGSSDHRPTKNLVQIRDRVINGVAALGQKTRQ